MAGQEGQGGRVGQNKATQEREGGLDSSWQGRTEQGRAGEGVEGGWVGGGLYLLN